MPVKKKVVESGGAGFTPTDLRARLADKGIEMVKGGEIEPVSFVPSGVPEIDELTGGFPRGHITEIFGPNASCKTTLCSRIAEASQAKTLYIDTEGGLISPPANIDIVREFQLEVIAETMEEALRSGEYDLIIMDSIASTTLRQEQQGEFADANMGAKARLMGQIVRRMLPLLRNSKTAVIFVNQLRSTLSSFAKMEFTPGGRAVEYAASLRLELRSTKVDKNDTYQNVKVTVVKSRFGPAYKLVTVKVYY